MGVAIQDQVRWRNTAKCDSEPRGFRYLVKIFNATFSCRKLVFKGALGNAGSVAIVSYKHADDRRLAGKR